MSSALAVHPSSVPCAGGATVWLTGLPSAGKSTIAAAVADRLRTVRCGVEILDGDVIRTNLSRGLGYSREDRAVNIRRIGFVAGLLARHGVIVLVASIAPHADVRAQVRADHEEHGMAYVEVHVSTPVEVATQRDVKGLYARHAAGEITRAHRCRRRLRGPRAPRPGAPDPRADRRGLGVRGPRPPRRARHHRGPPPGPA